MGMARKESQSSLSWLLRIAQWSSAHRMRSVYPTPYPTPTEEVLCCTMYKMPNLPKFLLLWVLVCLCVCSAHVMYTHALTISVASRRIPMTRSRTWLPSSMTHS